MERWVLLLEDSVVAASVRSLAHSKAPSLVEWLQVDWAHLLEMTAEAALAARLGRSLAKTVAEKWAGNLAHS